MSEASTSTRTLEAAVPLDDVAVVDVLPDFGDPATARKAFRALAPEGVRAIILNSQNANGAIPDTLTPLIQESTDRGVPVFVVAANYGTDHGVLDVRYDSQRAAVDAGATLIRDVNVNHLSEVAQAAQLAINGGRDAVGVNQALIDQFGAAAESPLR